MEQPTPSAADAADRIWVGSYHVLGRLAVGGMSELFLAEEAVDGEALRYVVIKLLPAGAVDPEAERLFLREGRTLLRLDHPHICHSYAFGKVGARCYIAMEWIDGVSLRELLLSARDQGRALSHALSANLLAQVAAGLEHAHGARDAQRSALHVVHRDVNPTNVMVRHDGVVKLIDFGVAQVAERRGDSDPQLVRGKLAYMAPEQVRGEAVDHRADIFALGVCLYELLTGTRLYRRGSREATASAVLDEPVPSVRAVAPDVPEELDAIVQRALQKDPAARFASAGELGAALEDYLVKAGEPMGARPLAALMRALFPHHSGQPALDVLPDLAARFSDPGPLPDATSPKSELPPPELALDGALGNAAAATSALGDGADDAAEAQHLRADTGEAPVDTAEAHAAQAPDTHEAEGSDESHPRVRRATDDSGGVSGIIATVPHGGLRLVVDRASAPAQPAQAASAQGEARAVESAPSTALPASTSSTSASSASAPARASRRVPWALVGLALLGGVGGVGLLLVRGAPSAPRAQLPLSDAPAPRPMAPDLSEPAPIEAEPAPGPMAPAAHPLPPSDIPAAAPAPGPKPAAARSRAERDDHRAAPRESNPERTPRARRRRASPGFIEDPGF